MHSWRCLSLRRISLAMRTTKGLRFWCKLFPVRIHHERRVDGVPFCGSRLQKCMMGSDCAKSTMVLLRLLCGGANRLDHLMRMKRNKNKNTNFFITHSNCVALWRWKAQTLLLLFCPEVVVWLGWPRRPLDTAIESLCLSVSQSQRRLEKYTWWYLSLQEQEPRESGLSSIIVRV